MVLMYHNIAREEQQIDFKEWQPAYDVSYADFLTHLALFRAHEQARARLHLTFDDGYGSLYRLLWPLLEKDRIRCTCFVTTAKIGAAGMLCREEIVALAQAGVEFGTHSHSHVFLAQLTRTQLEQEVLVPQKILADLLGKEISTMSLPGGRYDEALLEYASVCGFREIFTSKPGHEPLVSSKIPNVRLWPRWVITADSTTTELTRILRESKWHISKSVMLHQLGKLGKRALGNTGYHFLWQNLQYLKTSFRSGKDTS
ncbi:polysaccharide deacetylase family protein [candidate division KSB1 bacterium]|nr:polysaccharide deacetylase family protein [candidate division KSB1 bacterium]